MNYISTLGLISKIIAHYSDGPYKPGLGIGIDIYTSTKLMNQLYRQFAQDYRDLTIP